MDGLAYTVSLVDLITAPAKAAAGSIDKLRGGLAQMKPATENGAAAMRDLDGLLEALGPIASGAAEAFTVLTGALAAGVVMAIKASEAKTQMIALFDAMGEGKIRGAEVDDMLDGMRDRLGITKDAMVPFTTEILKMGITSKDVVESMTQAALSAKALAGGADSGADAFLKMAQKADLAAQTTGKIKLPAKALAEQFAEMGLNIDDVSAAMGTSSKVLAEGLSKGTIDATKFGTALQDALVKKGASPLQTMSLSIGNLSAMLKEYVGDLFEDMGPSIKPLLLGLKDMIKLLDSNTASGKAIKNTVMTVFGGIFKILTAMLPTVKHVFLEMVIGALKIYIAAKPLVKELEKLFGSGNDDTVGKALMGIVDFMVNGIVFTLQFYAVMIRVWQGIYQAIQPVIKAVEYVIEAIGKAGKAIASLTSTASSGGAGAGGAVGAGLVKGISAATGGVVGAGIDLGKSAIKGVTSALGIASPSKEMMKLGGHTAEGFKQGVDAGAPKAKSAMQNMAAPPAAAGGKGGGRGPIAVTFNVYGVEGASELKADLPTMMAQAFEKLSLMGGT